VLRLSSVTWSIVAKRCILEQKLLLRAYRKSYKKSIATEMNDLDLCLEVVSRSRQPLRYIWRWISRKLLETEAWFQRTTNRKWPMGYQMVTWPMSLVLSYRQLGFLSSIVNQNFRFVVNYAHIGCFPVLLMDDEAWFIKLVSQVIGSEGWVFVPDRCAGKIISKIIYIHCQKQLAVCYCKRSWLEVCSYNHVN